MYCIRTPAHKKKRIQTNCLVIFFASFQKSLVIFFSHGQEIKKKAMGVSQSCTLDRLSNLCQMEKCVMGINGRASDSASSTDTWVCDLDPTTTYRGKSIATTFMKIGINPGSMPKPMAGNRKQAADALDRIQAATGLMYEFQVYNTIITPILDTGICPNFLRSYLVSYNCQYDDLLVTLKKGLVRHGVDPEFAYRHLNRNLHYMYEGKDKRPAIQSSRGLLSVYPLPSLRYMVLTTEFNNVTDYWAWLDENHSLESRSVVLLQIVIGLYVMSKSKLMHNDLRAPNIFVQKLPQPAYWTYVIGDLTVCIFTVYVALIYDFDRATSVSLGENVFVKESGIYDPGIGLFEENRDIVCLYRSLLEDPNLATQSLIGRFFDVRGVAKKGEWYKGRGAEIPTTLFEAIRAIAQSLPALEPAGVVYRIESEMFMRDGTLNRDHEDLTALRAQTSKHIATLEEYKQALATCNAVKRRLEIQFDEAERNPKRARIED